MTRQTAVPLGILAGMVSGLLLVLGEQGSASQALGLSLAPLPLFMVGLGAGLSALGFGAVAGIGVAYWGGIALWEGSGGSAVVMFASAAALPALLLVGTALAPPQPPSAGRLVVVLTGLGVGGFALAYLAGLGSPLGLEGLIRDQLVEALRKVPGSVTASLPGPPESVVGWLARWFFGATVAVGLLNLAGVGVLAQSVLIRFGGNLRPAPSMTGLTLPRWLGLAFLVALVGSVASREEIAYVGLNLAEILAVPLLLQGLAVVHAVLRNHAARIPGLIAVYALMVLVWPAVPVVLLGLVEQAIGLRRFLPPSRR